MYKIAASVGARAFEIMGPKFFIDFSPGKACRASCNYKHK